MIKYGMVLCSALMYTAYAGNALVCLKSAAEKAEDVAAQEVANGDAKLLAEYIAGKAVPKLLENKDANKFLNKTHIAATENSQGGYDFSLFGIPVAATDAQPNAQELAAQLVPHIASAIVSAKSAQPASSQS